MMSLENIRTSNASLQSIPPGIVAVFAGATDGIGLGTLRQFARHTNGPIAFIIGRSEEKASRIIEMLKDLNPMGTFKFIAAEISLLNEVDRACDEIQGFAKHVDILYMSPGCLSFNRNETAEEIETALALEYYSRVRLTMNLLPLLELSTSPRVISVLACGFEAQIDSRSLDTINNLSTFKAIGQAATMTTLVFEELAKSHKSISFIHSYPGWVNTQYLDHLFRHAPGLWWAATRVPQSILLLVKRLAFIPADEAGERVLFLATSSRYPPSADHESAEKQSGWVGRPRGVTVARSTIMCEGRGNGVYRTDWTGDEQKGSCILDSCREQGLGRTVLEHTLRVFEAALQKVYKGS